ncbi:beta-aspartyl-peptidase [Alkalihalophilus marmarensis]|uniref:beta-aspartyl-peptidase n=1 Tax=Alkalihalophilus marmarensis TaxID=521377 RepID=UPI002E21907F|nr:beta-aspartyl-peptidase [Alkalihalophilus marmarensis]
MLTLIKNGDVFTPDYIGKKDVLIGGGKILAIDENITLAGTVGVEMINAQGMHVVPGFIDSHVHIIGGGGEGGFSTRTPELTLTEATKAGVTTIVGVLGTDGFTRTMPDLIAKAKALTEEGITCYVHTGSYHVPIQPVTGRIETDLMLIHEVIGVGEVAISDHRSAQPELNELKRLAAEARVGGMLSGKGGIVNVHIGDGADKLSLLEEIARTTEIPITQFLPTHINRNKDLLQAGIIYASNGGRIDLTTSNLPHEGESDLKCSKAFKKILSRGIDLSLVTFTSDAQGSLPRFNDKGEFTGLGIGEIRSLYEEVRASVLEEGIPLEQALQVVTRNVAKALKLKGKGELAIQNDADIVLLDKQDLTIDTVFAKGQLMISHKETIVKGTFE